MNFTHLDDIVISVLQPLSFMSSQPTIFPLYYNAWIKQKDKIEWLQRDES